MKITFWGVCGSVPAPLTPQAIDTMLAEAARTGKVPEKPASYGGNTPCVTVQAGSKTIVCDMGTGIRRFGQSIFRQIMAEGSYQANILMSHVHWDHIQGFPFFGPVYLPRTKFSVEFTLWGGVNWRETLETVLAGQMKDPKFPVDLKMISKEAAKLNFHDVYDRMTYAIPVSDRTDVDDHIYVYCRRLNHPNETYGYRISYGGMNIAYTTDNEGYLHADPALVDLVKDVDIWITDAQYTDRQYRGDGCVAHFGWGHSCPEHVIDAARAAKPKRIFTFHHDPDNGPEAIREIAEAIQAGTGIPTSPAREGDVIELPMSSIIDLDKSDTPPPVRT